MKLIAASLLLGLALPLHAQTTNQQWDYQYGMAKFYFAKSAQRIRRGGVSDPRLKKEMDWLVSNYTPGDSLDQPTAVLELETCEIALVDYQLQAMIRSLGETPPHDSSADIQSCIEKGHVIPQ